MPTITAPASASRRPRSNLAALKDSAFTLACTGLRSPAIARQLHIPERTIRRWVNDTLLSLAQHALDPDCTPNPPTNATTSDAAANGSGPATSPATSAATCAAIIPLERHRALAIESQRAVAATAHAAYDRLMARHDDLLDSLTTILHDNLTPATTTGAATPASLPSLPPAAALLTRLIAQLESGATRHLRIAQAAHREAARFQGIPAYAQTDARLTATEAHAQASADPNEDTEQDEGGHIPIRWIDPNDPNEVGLIPRHTFDPKAAIDAICNAPTSSLGKPQQATCSKHSAATQDHTELDDDEDDEQDEEAILAAILAEQRAGDYTAGTPAITPSATPPATGAATYPATIPATTSLPTSPDPNPRRRVLRHEVPSGAALTAGSLAAAPASSATTPATTPATRPATTLDERRSPYPMTGEIASASEPGYPYEESQRLSDPRMALLAGARYPPLILPGSHTTGALFLRNPNYIF